MQEKKLPQSVSILNFLLNRLCTSLSLSLTHTLAVPTAVNPAAPGKAPGSGTWSSVPPCCQDSHLQVFGLGQQPISQITSIHGSGEAILQRPSPNGRCSKGSPCSHDAACPAPAGPGLGTFPGTFAHQYRHYCLRPVLETPSGWQIKS